ncbi:hypothetical protein O9X99_16865 [Agrobacterium salinitolerans]|uniref:hypothetical protein n=1 Tax=Agrobacterium salinitolerans TaxID=1183413 RepID=UPI0022B84D6D|nr:hypothetical protein [Agrobacterium salinitolerans]MCZ7893345.1 hypothetical protein [Agrobacterium salinitolerans]
MNDPVAKAKAEEARQSQILADAIHKAIIETGKQFEVPILNAVGGALATNIAEVLAAISDRRHRKMFRDQLDRAVSIALAQSATRPMAPVETVIVGGVRQ